MVRSVQVAVEGLASPLAAKAAELLKFQVNTRCGTAICTKSKGKFRITLAIEPSIGAEGFRVKDRSASSIRIVGNDGRGLIYGVGRFLRGSQFGEGAFGPSSWRGTSVPDKPLRGIYFGAFGNYYCTAPLDEIRRYIEELALWDCNALTVVLPIAPSGPDDRAGQERLKRQRAIIEAGRNVGMSVGVLIVANEAVVASPELRAKGSGRGAFTADRTVCPSIPRGKELLLKQFADALAAFKDLTLDHLMIWPYDSGGCDCEQCRPWGSNGYLRIAKAEASLFRKQYPQGRIVLSTWYFDDGEWAGLAECFRNSQVWADYLLADNALAHFPTFPLDHGVPGGLPMLSFSEISMWDTGGWGPWGGFGANPAPRLLQRSWDQAGAKLAGGYPYSEGLFEDINKVIALQLCWDGRRKAVDIARDYAAFEYSPEVADDVAKAVAILEVNGPRVLVDQQAERYELRKDAQGKLRGVVRLGQPDVGAQRCYELLSAADAKLTKQARSAWRWRILLLHALIDKELMANDGLLTAECERATHELERIYHAENAPPTVKPPYAEWLQRVNTEQKEKGKPMIASPAEVTEKQPLPRVLIIGDSISIGYTKPVTNLLTGKVCVERIPANGASTQVGLANLSAWLGDTKWDLIHFNWGLHDLKHMKDGKLDLTGELVSDLTTYEKNLRELVRRLQATGAKLIWASTTPIPQGADGRIPSSEVEYNACVEKIMRSQGIAVDDLHAWVAPHLSQYQQPHNVHFTTEGYEYLAQCVAASIGDALKLVHGPRGGGP